MRVTLCSLLILAAATLPVLANTNSPSVVAVLQVDGQDDTFVKIDRAAAQAGIGPLLPMLVSAMAKGLGAPGLAGIDTNGILRICLALSAGGPGDVVDPLPRFVYTAEANDTDAYLEAVNRERGDPVRTDSLNRFNGGPGQPDPLYVMTDERGNIVAGTDEESVAYVAGLLLAADGGLPEPHALSCGIRLVADVPRLRPVFERVLQNAKRLGAGFGLKVPDAGDAVPGNVGDASPLDSVTLFTLGLSATDSAMEIRTALSPAPGSELAKCVAAMTPPSNRGMKGVSDKAYGFFAGTGLDCAEKTVLPFLDPLRKKAAGDGVVEQFLKMQNAYAGEVAAGIIPGPGAKDIGFVQVAALVEEGDAEARILAALRELAGGENSTSPLGEESVREHAGYRVHSYPLKQRNALSGAGYAAGSPGSQPAVLELSFVDGYAISAAGPPSIMDAVLASWNAEPLPFSERAPFASLFPDGPQDAVNLFAGRLVRLAGKVLAGMRGVNPTLLAMIPLDTGGVAGYTRAIDGDLLSITRIATDELAAAQGVALLVGGIVAQATLSPSSPGQATGRAPAQARCHARLRRIRAAKEQWALEKGLQPGAAVSKRTLSRYLPKGRMLTCPSGGDYSMNRVGSDPACSVPGHALR